MPSLIDPGVADVTPWLMCCRSVTSDGERSGRPSLSERRSPDALVRDARPPLADTYAGAGSWRRSPASWQKNYEPNSFDGPRETSHELFTALAPAGSPAIARSFAGR